MSVEFAVRSSSQIYLSHLGFSSFVWILLAWSSMFIVLDMKADKLNSLSKGIRHGSVEQSKDFVSSSVKCAIVFLQEISPSLKGQCKVWVDPMFRKQFCKVKVVLPACYIIQHTSDFLLTARLNSQQITGQDLRLPAVSVWVMLIFIPLKIPTAKVNRSIKDLKTSLARCSLSLLSYILLTAGCGWRGTGGSCT